MSSQLTQLRAAVDSLRSYELPEHFAPPPPPPPPLSPPPPADDDGGAKEKGDRGVAADRPSVVVPPPILDASLAKRYRDARTRYLERRIEQCFLEHLATYDGGSEGGGGGGTFRLPPEPSEDELDDLRTESDRVRSDLTNAAAAANERFVTLHAKFRSFAERREELGRIVEEMETAEAEKNAEGEKGRGEKKDDGTEEVKEEEKEGKEKASSEEKEDDDEALKDVDVDDGEMALQEERLAGLLRRREELEGRLRRVRAKIDDVEADTATLRATAQRMRNDRLGRKNGDNVRAVSPETIVDDEKNASSTEGGELDSIEEVERKTAEIRSKTKELEDMARWFDGVRATMEELGGMKILSVEEAAPPPSPSRSPSPSDGSNATPLGGDADASSSDVCDEDEIHLKIQLLDAHVLRFGLSSAPPAALLQTKQSGRTRRRHKEDLRVSSAKLLTPTLLTDAPSPLPADPNGDEPIAKPTAAIRIRIPPPDDLVRLSKNLGPGEDLRFVVRETMARIRIASRRVEELSLLRAKYLTKIERHRHDSVGGHGGIDQEVVCTVNEGVTVVLRLTPDCPLIEGSVYVDKIVGVGGWERSVLNKMKDKVNETRRRRPVEVMDDLVKEIARVEREEGVDVPRTPCLPVRKR